MQTGRANAIALGGAAVVLGAALVARALWSSPTPADGEPSAPTVAEPSLSPLEPTEDLPGVQVLGELGPETSLRDANLDGFDLSGVDLHLADLEGASLRKAKLNGADLRGAWLTGADLSGADLSGADLSDAWAGGVVLEGAVLDGADLRGAYLWQARLDGASAAGIDATEAWLVGSSMKGMALTDADLSLASLSGADLSGATVSGTLRGTDLSQAILTGATLQPIGPTEHPWAELPERPLPSSSSAVGTERVDSVRTWRAERRKHLTEQHRRAGAGDQLPLDSDRARGLEDALNAER